MERYTFFKKKEEERRNKHTRHALNVKEARFCRRTQFLDSYRHIGLGLDNCTPAGKPVLIEKKKSRLDLLKEWKEEKAKKANEIKQGKKPAFVAGKVHYKPSGSPNIPLRNITNPVEGVRTRSQMKGITSTIKKTQKKERPNFEFKKLNKIDENTFRPVRHHKFAVPQSVADLREKLTVPVSPKITKSKKKRTLLKQLPLINEESQARIPRARKGILFKVDQPLLELLPPPVSSAMSMKPIIESNTVEYATSDTDVDTTKRREAVTSPRSELTPDSSDESVNSMKRALELEAIMYSPFVEKKRGKQQHVDHNKTLDEKIEDEITAEENLKKSTLATFKLFLINETERLTALADKWKEMAKGQIPADVVGEVDAAKGKTHLLTTDKFKQFERLIEKFEAGDSQIRLGDLQGFHDWVNLEVIDMDKVFLQLQQRLDKNWIVTPPDSPGPPKLKHQPVKAPLKRTLKRPVGSSNLRAHILAKRHQMLVEQNDQVELPATSLTVASTEVPSPKGDGGTRISQRLCTANSLTTKAYPLEGILDINCLLVPPDGKRDRAIGAGDGMVAMSSPRLPTKNTPARTVATCSPQETRLQGKGTPSRTPSLYKSTLQRRCSGMEIIAASARARLSLTPNKCPGPSVETPPLATTSTPVRSILRKAATPVSVQKAVGFARGLDMKYLLPSEETPPDQSPVIISLVTSESSGSAGGKARRTRRGKGGVPYGTPCSTAATQTPTRRSSRLASKATTPCLR